MAELRRDFQCCGLAELDGISDHPKDPAEALVDAIQGTVGFYGDPYEELSLESSHVVFSQAYAKTPRVGYGDRLAAYIERKGLGTVLKSTRGKNPNTDNYITVFVWTIDPKALQAWFKREYKTRNK